MKSREQGFTLIELVAVLAVLAGAAALAMPLVSRGPAGASLRASTQQLASTLATARAAAMRAGREEVVSLDLAAGRFESRAGSGAIPRQISLEMAALAGERSGTAARIRFYPDGTATGGRIALVEGSRRAVITVDWLTGATSVDRSGW